MESPTATAPVPESKHPLSSKTIIGILLLLLPYVQKKLGIEFTNDDVQAIADNLLTIGGAILGIYGRYKARQPISSRGATIPAVVVLLAACLLTGCAPVPANVDHISGSVAGEYDGKTDTSRVEVGGSVYFRRPDPKVIKPLSSVEGSWGETLYHGTEVITPQISL